MSRNMQPRDKLLSLPSVVLDTNVVLDLLVFDDLMVRPLGSALAAGGVTAWADAHTLRELEYVLGYPTFALDEEARREVYARYRSLVRLVSEEPQAPLPPLPRCRDRDDQKFLTLAARAGATWLVSKDKRVLSLADRHGLPFAILPPRRAVERLDAPPK
jgi:putative PIN family toxin of toxin-antitoxin system